MGVYLSAGADEDALTLSWASLNALDDIMLILRMAYPSVLPEGMRAWAPEDPEGRNEESRYWRDETKPGIPTHKLRANFAYFVTREECQEALAIYEAMSVLERAERVMMGLDGEDLPLDEAMVIFDTEGATTAECGCFEHLWGRWIEFLSCAAADDGFAVW